MSLLIETLDLAVASPATVSRNGMVYNDYKDWGWWPFVNSWLDSVPDAEYREMVRVFLVKCHNTTLKHAHNRYNMNWLKL